MTKILARTMLLLAIAVIGPGWSAAEPTGRIPGTARDLDWNRPVENVSVVDQTWSREGGLLIANVTLANINRFPVVHVIVACEFVQRDTGTQIGNRGSLVPLVLSPGESRVGGIEFAASYRDMEGGKCRILSAQRMWSEVAAAGDQ